jgi:hypothetical protein
VRADRVAATSGRQRSGFCGCRAPKAPRWVAQCNQRFFWGSVRTASKATGRAAGLFRVLKSLKKKTARKNGAVNAARSGDGGRANLRGRVAPGSPPAPAHLSNRALSLMPI